MHGFLRNLQGKLDKQYDGRYFQTILAELATSEPKSLNDILKKGKIKVDVANKKVTAELLFTGKTQSRLADLAVLDKQNNRLLLVEIKVEDGLKSNAEQIRDYINYIRQNTPSTWFLFLSRYEPHLDDECELAKGKKRGVKIATLKFAELYGALDPSKPLARMLRTYLEDIGVTYQDLETEQAEKALRYLAKRALQLPENPGLKGLGGGAVVDGVSEVIEALVQNLKTLGDWLYSNKNSKSVT
jgi:hypothetical protein